MSKQPKQKFINYIKKNLEEKNYKQYNILNVKYGTMKTKEKPMKDVLVLTLKD